jgi:NhaP-type Na+/H+ or K+/H+ antiporter
MSADATILLLGVFLLLVFAHSLVSGRLQRTVVTPPILFTAAGMLVLPLFPQLGSRAVDRHTFLQVAELGLVLLLFTDASRTNLGTLRRIRSLPARLLGGGMPLTLLLGALVARVVFPGFSVPEAGILSAILAPTDAGLGQVIVDSPRVPLRIRQALNVEAGLNDGLSVPFLLFFIALAGRSTEHHGGALPRFVVEQLGYGTLIGLGLGLAGGWLLGLAHRRRWTVDSVAQLGLVTLPLLCILASETVGASMFIASFVAGLAVQVGFEEAGRHSVEFTEGWGQLFNLSIFFLFGLLVARDWRGFELRDGIYAVASLTVVRMAPVALALAGTRLSAATVSFMGWFGPRGLASIVLGAVYLEQQSQLPGEDTIRMTVIATVLLSIFAHGLSARPGIELYAARIAALDASAPEHQADEAETGSG